jgi:hypothetical protein
MLVARDRARWQIAGAAGAPVPSFQAQALAKKPNYDFEKRKKEQDRKKKKDAKREERLLRKRGDGEPEDDSAGETAIDANATGVEQGE